MKDIRNINLGGFPFAIDIDAHDTLEHYLHTIESHFRRSEGFEDIVSDIEARIAEILREDYNGDKVITKKDVEIAIAVMGTPEDFGASSSYDEEYEDLPYSEFTFGKKLMRDPSDKILGGVCSGLAAYFGIRDAMWVRAGFGILFFGAGIGVIPYLILWGILPEATTASDRLEMRGEEVNVDNIAKEIEEGFEKFTDKVTELTDKISKKKVKNKVDKKTKGFRSGAFM